VRNRALHDQLRAFAGEAARLLDAALEGGSEIPFEVAESPGARAALYRYKPLTAEFILERSAELRLLEAYQGAVSALARVEGASAYLRVLGANYVPALERDRAEATLMRFLARVWEESSTFELDDARFERAYRELESIAYEDTVVNTVVAPVLGVRLEGERWELGSGIALVRGDLCEAPPEAVWASGRDGSDPNTLVTLMVESTPKEPPPLTAARMAFHKLLTALRLFKPGGAALGSTAWWRTDEGPWQTVPLGFAGRSRGGSYWLESADRTELAELFDLLRTRPASSGPLPWALGRFELGCEHPVAIEGLSDHLLALRALLDSGERSDASIARRLAALCAEPADQAAVRERVQQAFWLERLVMRGDVDADCMSAIGVDSPDIVVRELEENLRALMRDMVCGHIDADARGVADELLPPEPMDPSLLEAARLSSETPDFVVRRRREATTSALLGIPEAPSLFEPTDTFPRDPDEDEPSPEAQHDPPTAEAAAVGSTPDPAVAQGPDGVEDWGLDDDAADYSAAV
jgi:hypothetical protein